MTEPVRDALRAVMRGTRLTREETRRAFEAILAGSEPPTTGAALLGALAALGESSDEVAGVADVLRARALRPPVEEELAERAIDVCGTGGDGRGTFNVSTATAFVAAGAGVPVAKHGARAISSRCGSADVLAALGVRIEMPPERAAEALRRAGVTFLFAPHYHEAMKRVAPLRRELGIRTIFNLVGPLANPLGIRRQIVGVDRPERVPVLARALALLGAERAFVFSNEEGGDEILPFGRTRAAEVRAGAVRLFEAGPADFGLPEGLPEHLGGGSAEENAVILRRILGGDHAGQDAVLMNASAALVVAGRAPDFCEGAALARRSIEEGRARRALDVLVEVSAAP